MSRRGLVVALVLIAGCQRKRTVDEKPPPVAMADAGAAPTPQVRPPLPLAPIPADAETVTGVAPAPSAAVRIKRLQAGVGARPGRNDTVSLNFTGWRTSGEAFITTTERKRPLPRSLALMAPGFAAAVMTMQVGERAMLWIPPELGYTGPPQGTPELTIYDVELVSFDPAPATPPDVAAPPSTAIATPSGLRTLVVNPGTGAARPRVFDHVVYHYSAWDATGRMFDSSELRKRPHTTIGFREWPGLAEALTLMVVGERRRVWIPRALADASLPDLPPGMLCFELELRELHPLPPPPPTPPRAVLAAAPATAESTAGGARFVILSRGTGTTHPTVDQRVAVHFTGWTADGRLFDSSIPVGTPIDAAMTKFLPGWREVLPRMVVGDRARVWLPVELAFRGEPGRPAGPVVFELELVRIGEAPPPPAAPGARLVTP